MPGWANRNELPRGNEFTMLFPSVSIVPFDDDSAEEQIKDLHSRIRNRACRSIQLGASRTCKTSETEWIYRMYKVRRAVEDTDCSPIWGSSSTTKGKSDVNVWNKIVDISNIKYYWNKTGFYHLTKPNFIKRLKSYGIQVSNDKRNVAYLEEI